MNEQGYETYESVARRPGRALATAKIGLVGLAAAAIIGATALAAGAWASPSGTRAANGGTTSDPSVPMANGGGPMGGPMAGHRGGRGEGFGAITITSISGSSVSLKTADGWTRTISIASDTVLQKAGATIKLADLKVGDEVRFRETRQSDGTYKIDELDVVLPRVDGTVSAISGSTITIQGRDSSTTKVTVASGATVKVDGAAGSVSGIKVGMVLMAEGTKNSDGSLTASLVQAFDRSSFQGGFGHRGMGPGWGPNGQTPNGGQTPNAPAPNASGAPSSSGTTNNG